MPKDCPSQIHEATTVRRKLMFAIALIFLLLIAFSLQIIDHPTDPPEHSGLLVWTFVALWSVMFVESIVGYWQSADYSWRAASRMLLIWLVPPYRLVLATYPAGNCTWLPVLGWQKVDRHLLERLDRGFSIPMLLIALMVIPILGIEAFGAKYISIYPALEVLLDVGTSVIWLAFAFEFVLMSALAEKKLHYIAKNWINVAIILLPLVAFLRGFRIVRLLRLGKAAPILKTYRLRGLGMRAWRGVVTLELIELLLHRKPESRLDRLKAQLQDKEHDLEILRRRIRALEDEILSSVKQR